MTRFSRKDIRNLSILGLSLASAYACGSSSGGNKSSNNPPTVDTTLASATQDDQQVVLAFSSNIPNASFLCKADMVDAESRVTTGQWGACPASGYSIPVPAGSKVSVSVKALGSDGSEDPTPLALSTFFGKSAGGANNVPDSISGNPRIPAPEQPVPAPGTGFPARDQWQMLDLNSLNLGSRWTFQVPAGMHILQYAANYGIGSGIDVLQIMQGQDPKYYSFYPGSVFSDNGCGAFANQPVGIRSPGGDVLGYCAGKVRGESEIERLFGFRYAPNHIEVGSDANAPVQSRVLVQVHSDFRPEMGILNALCHGDANVSGFNEVFGAVPVMNDFWAFSYIRDNVKTCRTTLNGLNGDRWQIAGFIFTESTYAANYCQTGCNANSGNALEVVYLERNANGMTRYSDYFVRDFQTLIYNVLGRENAYVPF